jgi:dTDP-4-amino-4,6-dideoxygalactose transaminase
MKANEELAVFGGPKAVSSKKKYRWPLIGEEEIRAVNDLLRKGELSYYSKEGVLKEFEDAFAEYHGNVRFSIATNSGTSALQSAYFGIGIGPGSEVIAPTNTFLATVTPILQCNGIPVLCDCEPDTYNIDPVEVRKLITDQTRAIVVTHVYGHPCDMDEILKIADEHGLYVVEDASHAHGATYKGRKVGTIGDVGVFSLQAGKILVAGQGGILITDNAEIHDRATLLGHFRVRCEDCVTSEEYLQFAATGFGANMRIHPLGAAIAREQLKKMDRFIEARQRNLALLDKVLSEAMGIAPPVTREYATRGGQFGYKPLYKAEEMGGLPRSVYVKALQAEGVHVKPIGRGLMPLHLLPLFQVEDDRMFGHGCPRACPHAKRRYTYRQGDFPVSEKVFATSLSFPTYTEDSSDLIEQFAIAFDKVGKNAGRLVDHTEEVQSIEIRLS